MDIELTVLSNLSP